MPYQTTLANGKEDRSQDELHDQRNSGVRKLAVSPPMPLLPGAPADADAPEENIEEVLMELLTEFNIMGRKDSDGFRTSRTANCACRKGTSGSPWFLQFVGQQLEK